MSPKAALYWIREGKARRDWKEIEGFFTEFGLGVWVLNQTVGAQQSGP